MFRDLLREAYGAMQHDRRRATLTMLGMAWGIATVILLLAYGAGFGMNLGESAKVQIDYTFYDVGDVDSDFLAASFVWKF